MFETFRRFHNQSAALITGVIQKDGNRDAYIKIGDFLQQCTHTLSG